MGEIVIKKKNTTIDLFNYKPFRSVTKAELSRTLMSDDYVDISVECANPLDLNLGDRVTVEGRTFFLNMLPPAKKLAEDQFSYELRFEGPAFLLRKLKVFNLDSQGNKTTNEFPLTGEINEFLYLLINNANKKDDQWILGSFPSNTETKTLTFSNENCLAVLQRICQEFKVEFDIVESGGKFVLNLREKIGKLLPFTVEYGMGNGLYDLSRARANDSEVVTVLYAYGSSQNIPVDYRGYSPRLRMPVSVGDYITNQAAIDLFGYVEDVFTSEIKPTFNGIVSGVGSLANQLQSIIVSNMDFDLKEKKADGSTKYLIAGTPAKISVTKGDLAGYDFEVVDYIHATKTFKLKQFADDKGQKFPDDTTVFKFAAGDEFTLIDIMMPEQYITNAEQKLYDETVKEYQKVSQNNVKYTLNVDPLFLQDKGEIGIGDLLPIKDADFGIDKASRIISLKKDLLTDTYTSFDVADSYEISLVKEIVNNIKDLQKEIASQKVINRQSYLDGYRRVEDRFSMYFDADGKMDGSHIKADTIDVGMLSSGSKSRWFQLEEVVFTTNLGSDQNSFRATAGRLVHFGIKTNTGTERVWNIAALTVSNLLNQGYYVYAKCDINGDFGTFVITPDRIVFDSQPNYYHFLIGNLYSPSNGFRIFDANYGVSQVNGRQITAGEIASVNRRLIIDLDKGEIIGKVTFTDDSPALVQVQGKIDAVQEVIETEITVAKQNAANAQNTANTANQEAIEAKKVLSDIANDNIVTPQKKPDLLQRWKSIESERPKLIAQAGTYNVNTDDYNNYYAALANYLTNSGVFIDMSANTNVDGHEFNSNFQNYYDVRQDLLKAISDATKTYANFITENAKTEMSKDALNKALAASYASGNCLYRDVDFRNGLNGLGLYNNSNPNTNTYLINFSNVYSAPTRSPQVAVWGFNANNQPTSPGYGGFYFNTQSRASAVFVMRLIMRVPEGIAVEWAANRYGDGGTFVWTTPTKGTGKFEEYICIVRCGVAGVFEGVNFIWFNDTGYGNRPFEVVIAYASVFDMTDVDKYLEDKIKQNEQQTAIAKAQADNALATSNATSQKVSFLSTTINNNVIATGTLMVGDVVGANALITGVTDRGEKSVRMAAGTTYSSKNTAAWNVLDDGTMNFHHPNGNLAFEFGLQNGKFVMNGYHESGFKIFELSPNRGLVNVAYIPESWTLSELFNVNQSQEALDENAAINTVHNAVIKTVDQWGDFPDIWNTVELKLNTNYSCWEYYAGTHPDNEQYQELNGYKTVFNSRTDNVNGWYGLKIGSIYINSYPVGHEPPSQIAPYVLYYISAGKITKTKTIQLPV